MDAYQQLDYSLVYLPNDVSRTILEETAIELLKDYPSLSIHGLVGTYELALEKLASSSQFRRLVCFLGSTLGNFNQQECESLFSQVANSMNKGDYLLLGIDLQKSPGIIEAAYNDSQGVTAAFNLNMLEHLNKRFQGNFDLNLFEHLAFYHPLLSQIEMHLVSQIEQVISLEALDLEIEFSRGETILTEISRKFDLEMMKTYLEGYNYKILGQFTDLQQWFGLLLCELG